MDQERKGVFLAVFEFGAVEGDQQFGSLLAGCERYRRRNGEQTRLVAGENRYGQRLVLGDAFYRDGDGGDVVADAMLGGHILGEVDLCAVDLGTCFEVIVAAGREQPRDDGDSRQKNIFILFINSDVFYLTDLTVWVGLGLFLPASALFCVRRSAGTRSSTRGRVRPWKAGPSGERSCRCRRCACRCSDASGRRR